MEISKKKIPIEREDLGNTFLWVSECKLGKEDRLICYSDGVSQSGMGTPNMPFGWDEGVKTFISELLNKQPNISAKEMARKIVLHAERNDGYKLKDDTSCSVVYRRTPRNLLICTGPPYDEKKDRYLAETIKGFNGKKILCGGTTASIVSRELKLPLTVSMEFIDKELPPLSYMDGIDLVTEGILTLTETLECLEKGTLDVDNAAGKLIKFLLDSDCINFMVGAKLNQAHYDPALPVEIEIRKNIIKKMADVLQTKYFKQVNIQYM